MYCSVYNCNNNENGSCSRSDYVMIDRDGRCDSVSVPGYQGDCPNCKFTLGLSPECRDCYGKVERPHFKSRD